MGLKEVMEETKKQLEEAEKANQEEITKQQEADEAEKKAIEEPEEKKEEAKDVEEKETSEEQNSELEKPKKTGADYARERREKVAEAQRLRDELAQANALIAELTKPKEEKKEAVDPEPNKEENPTDWADWRARQAEKKAEAAAEIARQAEEKIEKEEKRRQGESLIQQAQSELQGFEAEFKKDHPDYDGVRNFYINTLAYSIKTLNPKISNDALVKAVNSQLLATASQYYNEGYANPIEPIYEMAKSMGYQPAKETKAEEVKKPDMSRVAKNRERNAGMAASAGGSGKGELTKHYAATEMTSAEWARLPTEERERLMRG